MWFAPIGSLEYTKNLHSDLLIKRYILSEQRLKQLNNSTLSLGLQDLSTTKNLRLETSDSSGKKILSSVNKNNARLNRIKGCAVDVILKRSFKKTTLNVITYDSLSG